MQTNISTFDISSLNQIFNVVLKGVNSRDREDVKSEAIVRVLTEIDKGSIKTNAYSFMRTVIQRTVFDYYRKNRRKITQNTLLVHYSDGEMNDLDSTVTTFTYGTTEFGYSMVELRNDYLNNISLFTAQETKIIDFMLFTEEGMGMKPTEISNLLEINKSHASRAMKKLKQICQ
ncbi:sigma-70 family RNA polymerase sigma factor [Paenibacillus arenosi]|uniref:Sigma-70 family RNA polymerase sigma factor n=1 Tax=Paenibacillus arenosi TaxID=2774142 RepID=A0ABR9AXM9_9BACL|nr:sigma-70 family RNA polymerase sigma factor [Paenibacillus arenosi]MBD8498870.1 sigma-70 family RNA polymerase sigma factor [Paenibacillus arenosi]